MAWRSRRPRLIGKLVRSAGLVSGLALLVPTVAFADAIDGAWCKGAQSFTITGPTIVTPAGTELAGDYSRHGYRYVVPASEPEAGAGIDMVLVHDDRLELTRKRGEKAEPSEIWQRCKPVS